jgi:hypothetical protein
MAVPLKITPFDYTSFFNDLDRNGMEKVNSASSCQKTASQEGCAKAAVQAGTRSRRMRISNQTGRSVNQRKKNNVFLLFLVVPNLL